MSNRWKDVAEFVGIGAIVASLIFVGLQMQQDQEIARAQSIAEIASGGDWRIAMAESSDILIKAKLGGNLDEVEKNRLQMMMKAADDRLVLQNLAMSLLGFPLTTSELEFAAFLYTNPVARAAWLQVDDDMERYVNPLRTPESLARTRENGSEAFRERIKMYLAELDDLHRR